MTCFACILGVALTCTSVTSRTTGNLREYSERSRSDQLRWHSSGRAFAQDRDKKMEEWPIGAEMGEQKCCSTHKVVQPWAGDAVSLRELPVHESLTDSGGSSARTPHLGR